MATTALLVKEEGKEIRMLFMTAPTPTGVDVDIIQADIDFMPVGKVSIGVDHRDEETYHRELRKHASEAGDFVPDFSTNPEWNPGYVEPTEEEEQTNPPEENV